MKKLASFLLIAVLVATACNKKSAQEQLTDPKAQSTIVRSFDYPNRPATLTANHEPAAIDAVASRYTDGMTIHLNASPKVKGSVGDGIVINLGRDQIKNGYIGSYVINAALGSSLRYVYSYLSNTGTNLTNILDSWNGMEFEGELTIDTYDAARNLMSGTYRVQINNLINDPTKDVNEPANPNDLCNITVRGLFANVKIKQ